MEPKVSVKTGQKYIEIGDKIILESGKAIDKEKGVKGSFSEVNRELDKAEVKYNFYKTLEKGELVEIEKKRFRLPVNNIIRIVMLIVGTCSMVLSIIFNFTFLKGLLPSYIAAMLAGVITVFATSAFEAVMLFKKQGNYFLSVAFSLLWVLIASYSITTIVAVNYSNYMDKEDEETYTEANAARARIAIIDEQIKIKDEQIDGYNQSIDFNKSKGWHFQDYTRMKNNVLKEKNALQDEKIRIIQSSPDAVSKHGEKKDTLMDYISRLFGISGKTVRFIMSALPALFMDIISPLSMAVSIFLLPK